MDVIRYLRGRDYSAIAALCIVTGTGVAIAFPELRDEPVVWHDDDRRDIAMPEERDPNLIRDAIESSFFQPLGRLFNPARIVRHVGSAFGGDHVRSAANVNSLDEVPNSSWFTNRIGLFPVSPEAAARGLLVGPGPDRSSSWTVIAAKTEGVTPGFSIRDARGDSYLIKFDPPGYGGTATAAGVISGRILHTAGYNVPEDVVVRFGREMLTVGEDVEFSLPDGTRKTMTSEDLDQILERAERKQPGTWRALASKYLSGVPRGPFAWRGTREDDPNDRIDHEDRRELRGLRIFAAWLSHYDTKQGNTLDTYVEEDGHHFLRHHLIDFASTLGAGGTGPYPVASHEFTVDFAAVLKRMFTLGLVQDRWRKIQRPPGLSEVAYFESEVFEPMAFRPISPNAAFANLTDRDGYWAAKIISAFTDDHIAAIVAEGGYSNPDAARWVARVLGERRDKIARYCFDRIAPLDFFVNTDGVVSFHDLGVERGLYSGSSARYRSRVAAANAFRSRGAWSEWEGSNQTTIDLNRVVSRSRVSEVSDGDYPFLALEVQVNRGSEWSSGITVYVARQSGRVVALDR